MNILDFDRKKRAAEKIVMVTCYEYYAAKMVEQSSVDCVLVGDSVAMVVHGYHSTVMASMEMMRMHTQAVARGIHSKFIIADLPFLSYRKDISTTINNVEQLIHAGAHAVKLEGCAGNLETIRHIIDSGVPVMGHLGMTPQSVNLMGGHKIQGRHELAAAMILEHALSLQQAGCFAIVLECIPAVLAKKISEQLTIPTIGIGAGPNTDGQVLVWHDVLGMQHDIHPKFLKRFLNSQELIQQALNQYAGEVQKQQYPDCQEHVY